LESGDKAKIKKPKLKGGLGVIKLGMHNEVLLMKHLHKFFSKQDLPWVKLIWGKYYSNGKLPKKTNKGSFWWSGVLKLQSTYKGIAQAQMGLGDTIFFWDDLWNGQILKLSFHELHSYAINGSISVISVLNLDSL
jgi:hypothetical protein